MPSELFLIITNWFLTCVNGIGQSYLTLVFCPIISKLFLEFLTGRFFTVTIDHETGSWKSYLNSICTFFHFFTFTRARIKLSLLEARFSHVFRGRFIVHCRVNRRPRSCLGPKSLAISTPTRTWTTFGSTSCQISLISKVFPLPISLVSSHYSQPPLTLGEFVHGGRFICQVLFPQRNCSIFKEKEYETERKFLLTIDT